MTEIVKKIKEEFAKGNFDVDDIVVKTNATKSTVRTQKYKYYKEHPESKKEE